MPGALNHGTPPTAGGKLIAADQLANSLAWYNYNQGQGQAGAAANSSGPNLSNPNGYYTGHVPPAGVPGVDGYDFYQYMMANHWTNGAAASYVQMLRQAESERLSALARRRAREKAEPRKTNCDTGTPTTQPASNGSSTPFWLRVIEDMGPA